MRLIDAEQFKHKINNSELYDSEEWVKVLDILADCDSIDAVPVVRCKDCKWAEDTGPSGIYCNHPDDRNPIGCNPDEFCNCGKKNEKR